MSRSRRMLLGFGIPLALLLLIQLVPYGRSHTNSTRRNEPAWDTPRTRELAKRACFDCHSDETRWPWYAAVAPISWRLQGHVDRGRAKLNFSALDVANREMAEAACEAGKTVAEGTMPPQDYLLMHPQARLTFTERRALIEGLDATMAAGCGSQSADADRNRNTSK
jgi:hypothetical protein